MTSMQTMPQAASRHWTTATPNCTGYDRQSDSAATGDRNAALSLVPTYRQREPLHVGYVAAAVFSTGRKQEGISGELS